MQIMLCRAHGDGKVWSLDIAYTCAQLCAGPAFLPSEHDELPPGVAFMVGDILTDLSRFTH